MNLENSEYPCGYVESKNGKMSLTFMNSNLFPDFNSERYRLNINVGINEHMEKYEISICSLKDNEAELQDKVKNIATGEYVSSTELLKKHGAENNDVIVALHDYGNFYRLFVNKFKAVLLSAIYLKVIKKCVSGADK